MIRLAITGICGTMGRVIARTAKSMPDTFTVVAGVDPSGEEMSEGVKVYPSFDDIDVEVDALIDFSVPAALKGSLLYCQKNNVRLVVGTTGLSDDDKKKIRLASEKVPVFQSGNMSLGVNLQIELVKKAASALAEAYDVEIIEKHHKRKVDSPSGTALMLADAIKSQYASEKEYVFGRHSKNARRTDKEIGIHAIRGGTIVGEHSVSFIGTDEIIEITHTSHSKTIYAVGALRAAEYLMTKDSGFFDMSAIVTEKEVLSHLYTEDDQAIITVSSLPHDANTLSTIFDAVADANVFVDMISTLVQGGTSSEISFSLPKAQLMTAIAALKPLRKRFMGMDIHHVEHITKLSVEGKGMALRHGVAARFFSVMAQAGVKIELVTTSETKISCCLRTVEVPLAVAGLAKEFEL